MFDGYIVDKGTFWYSNAFVRKCVTQSDSELQSWNIIQRQLLQFYGYSK